MQILLLEIIMEESRNSIKLLALPTIKEAKLVTDFKNLRFIPFTAILFSHRYIAMESLNVDYIPYKLGYIQFI